MKRRFGFRDSLIRAAFAVALLLSPQAFAACSSPAGNAGDVIYSSTQNAMFYCNSSVWVNMGSAAGGTISSGTWNASTITVPYGGTGATSLTGILEGNGTSAVTALTGTANYDAIWTSADAIGTGLLYESGGNVGIGTASPSGNNSLLFVAGNISSVGQGQLTLQGATNANQQLVVGYNTGSDYGSIQAIKQGVSDEPLILNGGGGNVGIGTTNPNLAQLQTSGSGYTAAIIGHMGMWGAVNTDPAYTFNSYIDSSYTSRAIATGYGGLIWLSSGAAGGPAGSMVFYTMPSTTAGSAQTSNEAMRITPSGYIGIGTTSPVAVLDVREGTNQRLVTFAGGGSLGDTGGVGIDAINDANSAYVPLDLVASRFDFAAGNVGIGTTSPSTALQVVGTIYSSSGGVEFPDGTTQTTAGSSSIATSGYQKFPSGLIMQWSTVTASTGGTAATFPIAFPNNYFSVVVTCRNQEVAVEAASLSKTGFTALVSSGTPNCYYMALGN